ncbi:MAG: hypothetical protein RL557_312, partial [archaeon]
KADIIFITHAHYDHCSIEDIKKIIKPETIVVSTNDVQSKLGKVAPHVNSLLVESGKEYTVNGINFHTVHSYNLGKQFHPRDNAWVGYIIDCGGTRLYHAGDSDFIKEMHSVKADVCLFPVGGTYTMNAEEATRAAEIIKPSLAIPMHWGSIVGTKNDAERFVNGCKEKGIRAEILERE